MGPNKYDEYFMDILASEFKRNLTLETLDKLCSEKQ